MSKFCPSCGEELVDSAKFCKSCGKNLEDPKFNPHENPQLKDEQVKLQTTEKSHTLAIVLGYVLAVFISLLGIIISIYLLTRDSAKAKMHGKLILIVSVIFWILPWIFRF